jgi:hypothetical protein
MNRDREGTTHYNYHVRVTRAAIRFDAAWLVRRWVRSPGEWHAMRNGLREEARMVPGGPDLNVFERTIVEASAVRAAAFYWREGLTPETRAIYQRVRKEHSPETVTEGVVATA